MIRNYFALYELARELSERFTGGYIFECFSQEKGELRISLFTKEKERFTLVCTTGKSRLAVYYSEDFARRRRNSVALMSAANDKQIAQVRLSELDRIIYFHLEDSLSFAFQLFSADTNFFLIKGETILEAFKKNNELKGSRFCEPTGIPILSTLEGYANDKSLFTKTFSPFNEKELQKHLPLILTGFDSNLSREALFRALQMNTELSMSHLHEAVSEIFYELISPEPKVYQGLSNQGKVAYWFSIIDEKHRPFESFDAFESINEAMKFYSFKVHQEEHFGKEIQILRKQIERLIEKTESQLHAIKEQSSQNRAEKYEQTGTLLMANLHLIEAGQEVITLVNFYNGETQSVLIDPKKTPYQNAEAYFEKAKKTRLSDAISRERYDAAEQNLSQLRLLITELQNIIEPKMFEQWRKKHLATLRKFLLVSKEEATKQTLFRRFKLTPNVELWVGKNAKNNDLLTFKYARPNDLWLHARGVSGSHCILKSNKPPTKDELERAASIAAYYSSAKSSELAAVICTPKKYVRKPKGADVGAVVVEREEVLLVKPQRSADIESDD